MLYFSLFRIYALLPRLFSLFPIYALLPRVKIFFSIVSDMCTVTNGIKIVIFFRLDVVAIHGRQPLLSQ